MSLTAFIAFVLVSAAQVATPGPSTIFLLNNAIVYGAGRAIVALSGDLVAIVILASLSAAGVGALLATNPALFAVLRIAGAAYLLWLGALYFRAPPVVQEHAEPPGAGTALWLQSFWIGISNPKAVLFFAALFPQFIPADGGRDLLTVLVIAFVTTKLIVLGAYAMVARQLRRALSHGGDMAFGRRLTGALFILFGCVMIWPLVA